MLTDESVVEENCLEAMKPVVVNIGIGVVTRAPGIWLTANVLIFPLPLRFGLIISTFLAPRMGS